MPCRHLFLRKKKCTHLWGTDSVTGTVGVPKKKENIDTVSGSTKGYWLLLFKVTTASNIPRYHDPSAGDIVRVYFTLALSDARALECRQFIWGLMKRVNFDKEPALLTKCDTYRWVVPRDLGHVAR